MTAGIVVALHLVLAATAYPFVAVTALSLAGLGFLAGAGVAAAYDAVRTDRRTVCVPGTGTCLRV